MKNKVPSIFYSMTAKIKKLIKTTEKTMNTDNTQDLESSFADIEVNLSEMLSFIYTAENITHSQKQIFYCLFVKAVVVKAMWHKKQLNFKAGIEELDNLKPILKILKESEKSDTIHYLIKAHLTYESLYL